jgi:hypothetical protein
MLQSGCGDVATRLQPASFLTGPPPTPPDPACRRLQRRHAPPGLGPGLVLQGPVRRHRGARQRVVAAHQGWCGLHAGLCSLHAAGHLVSARRGCCCCCCGGGRCRAAPGPGCLGAAAGLQGCWAGAGPAAWPADRGRPQRTLRARRAGSTSRRRTAATRASCTSTSTACCSRPPSWIPRCSTPTPPPRTLGTATWRPGRAACLARCPHLRLPCCRPAVLPASPSTPAHAPPPAPANPPAPLLSPPPCSGRQRAHLDPRAEPGRGPGEHAD